MPNITVVLLSGRTMDQKRRFVEAVTDASVAILGGNREEVWIRMDEMETWDVANGGIFEADTHGIEVPGS